MKRMESAEYSPAFGREGNTILFSSARITLITDRLIRLEWSEDGIFENRPTLAAVNRDCGDVSFQVETEGKETLIRTEKLAIRYRDDGKEFSPENLSVNFELNGETVTWVPGMKNTGNLLGTARTLDHWDGGYRKKESTRKKMELDEGFLSRSGWTLVDDSKNVVMVPRENGKKWVAPRTQCRRLDWYLLVYGHDYRAALKDASGVFGCQPLIPRYALGYWYSRYWAYSDTELEEIVEQFQRSGTPIDVLVVDMDWHLEGWTGYTWDRRYFPDPDGFLRRMKKRGLKVTLNLHPADGVGSHEAAYPQMCKALGLDPEKKEKIPFNIADPDYMDAYFKYLHHPEEERGVDFWWMDWQQGEVSFMRDLDPLPWLNILHWNDIQDRAKGKRPLIFSRYGGIGAGRCAIGFSGDTWSTWDSLSYQVYFTPTASNVLYGYWSHDLGGHIPGAIPPELYLRWLQFGAYSPIMRTHTTKNLSAERRFWAYPEPYSSLMRETILLRYSLVPYIYSEDWKMHRTGVSLLHPMYCDYPEQEEAYRMDRQYMFGDSLLVSPVISPGDAETGLAEKKTWLPAGKWFDTIQGRLMNGETVLTEKYLLNEIPVFAKAGAIIPSQSGVHNLNGKCYKNLGCTIYPGESGEYLLYEDDGISTGYLSGKFALIRFSHRRTESERVVEIKLDSGTFEGFEEKRSFEIRLPGVIPPSGVQLENAEIQKCKYPDEHAGEPFWSYNGDRAEILISLPEISLICGAEIRVRYAERDEYSKAAGLTGILARMKEIAFLQDLLNLRGTPYGNGRLGRELAAAGRRISLAPENFENEMANFRMKFPILRKVLEDVVREKPETPAGIRCAATIGKALKLYEEILKFL